MDAVSLILIFLFFILPIIQQVLERSRRGAPGEVAGEEVDEEGAEWEEVVARKETPTPERLAPAIEEESDSWSGGWGSWPEPAATLPETFDSPAPPRPVKTAPAEAAPTQVERVFRTEVARSGPEVRFGPLEPLAELNRVGPARRSAKALQPNLALEGRKAASRGSTLPLRSTAELRQAIVLGEVLGPPLSIRRPVERA